MELLQQIRQKAIAANKRIVLAEGEEERNIKAAQIITKEKIARITLIGDPEVIKKTVSINQDIAESIRNENEQFTSINAMAESNANDTAEVVSQASAINGMVDEISKLLGQEE